MIVIKVPSNDYVRCRAWTCPALVPLKLVACPLCGTYRRGVQRE